jgi:hypothetical protein
MAKQDKKTVEQKEDNMTNTTPVKQETTKAVGHAMPSNIVAPHIGKDDFVAAKILPIHYISEKAKGKTKSAEPGEFRDTIENKLFGSIEKPFDFIPLHMTTFWAIYDMTEGGQGKYLSTETVNAANENLPREEVIGKQKIKRIKTYECYVLLPEEVKTGTAFPYVLSFRVTSARAGKTLLTQLYVKNAYAGKPPYANVCELSLTEEANDHGDFFVQHTKPKRTATAEELAEAEKWYGLITAGQVAKDDSDLKGSAEEEMKATDTKQF